MPVRDRIISNRRSLVADRSVSLRPLNSDFPIQVLRYRSDRLRHSNRPKALSRSASSPRMVCTSPRPEKGCTLSDDRLTLEGHLEAPVHSHLLSIGVMTVGPVTETIDPKSRLNSHVQPKSNLARTPASTVVIDKPTVTSPITAREVCFNSRRSSSVPPSKTTIATDALMTTRRILPSASGWIIPPAYWAYSGFGALIDGGDFWAYVSIGLVQSALFIGLILRRFTHNHCK